MNATGKTILISALACLTTGHLSCTGELAGAGSETTNGITGFVRNRDGTPAAAVIVKLLSSDFNRAGRDTISGMFIDTTDLRGAYLFTRVDTGSYILIMRDPPRKTGCKIEGIAYRESETLLSAPPGDLVPTGTILIPLGENASDGELVFIPGTDVYTTISGDTAVLEGIPRGSVASVYLTSGTGGPKLICSDVMVNPEDTVRITKPFWLRSGSISVNTTSASGAFLRKPLFGFPALLRLSPENFRFEEAGRGGYDVRFTKTDGSDLPFEISRWDESAQRAEIWIVLDTLHPDTVTRIVMHWGNPDATQAASPNSVFDTSRGFQGVWHLETGDSIPDATANGYHGILVDGSEITFTEGIVGRACRLDGSQGYIRMPGTSAGGLSFPEDGEYTVSAWVFLDSVDDGSHVVLSKGNYHYFLFYTSIHTSTPLWEFSEYQSGVGWELSAAGAESGAWHHIAGVRNGSSQRLYIDGIPVDSTGFTYNAAAPSDMGYDLVIGRFLQDFSNNNYCFFDGMIDEVRICSVDRGDDWLRMSYENQKSGSTLLHFMVNQE